MIARLIVKEGAQMRPDCSFVLVGACRHQEAKRIRDMPRMAPEHTAHIGKGFCDPAYILQ